MKSAKRETTIPIRVVVYRDEGSWVSHALDMDVVGCGDSEQEAFDQMRDAVESQITFCRQKKIDPIQHAPRKYFEMWTQVQEAVLQRAAKIAKKKAFDDRFARFLDFPLNKIKQSSGSRNVFQVA